MQEVYRDGTVGNPVPLVTGKEWEAIGAALKNPMVAHVKVYRMKAQQRKKRKKRRKAAKDSRKRNR